MITICRTRTLQALRGQLNAAHSGAEAARAEAAQLRYDAAQAADSVIRAEQERDAAYSGARKALRDLAQAHADRIQAERERDAARSELAAAAATPGLVYVLLHHGELHSVHPSVEAAYKAAEHDGAARGGWVDHQPGDPVRPAAAVAWRVTPLPLGGAR
jgi:hypothetical protein